MTSNKSNSYRNIRRQPKRIKIDLKSFLQVKSILYSDADDRSRHFQAKIDHFQALSLIDWCKVSEKKRGEIRQELREKGIDEALADKIKDRKKIEEPKALEKMCQDLRLIKRRLENGKQSLIDEINFYQWKLTTFESPSDCSVPYYFSYDGRYL